MRKWSSWKFLAGNVQLAISEIKISFPKILGHFSFQLKYPNRSRFFLGDKYISLDGLYTLQGAWKSRSKAFGLTCSLGVLDIMQ